MERARRTPPVSRRGRLYNYQASRVRVMMRRPKRRRGATPEDAVYDSTQIFILSS